MSRKREITETLGIASFAVRYQRVLRSEHSLHWKPLGSWGGVFGVYATVCKETIFYKENKGAQLDFYITSEYKSASLDDRVWLKIYFNFWEIPLFLVTATRQILKI